MTTRKQKQANMEGKLNISLKDKNCITNKQIKQDKCKKAQNTEKMAKKREYYGENDERISKSKVFV